MSGVESTVVSVIIPTYNYGRFLDECLGSVYRQEGVNTEVIVVDDGSTDHTADVLKRHRGRIRIIQQENSGLAAARNIGLRACTGDYVQFLDADDMLGRGSIRARVETLKSVNNKGVAVCRNRIFGRVGWGGVPLVKGWWMLFREHLDIHLCRLNIAPPHSFLVPREVVEKVGRFDETMRGCEDYDYWLRALGANYSPVFCEEGRVYYRKHGASMGSTKKRMGAFPFDILVQEKKHRGLYGQGVDKAVQTLAGRLAYGDGLITTALKVDATVNAKGKNRLIELATIQLEKFLESAPPVYERLPDIAKLQLARVLTRDSRIRSLGAGALTGCFDDIKSRFGLRQTAVGALRLDVPFSSYENKMAWYCALELFARDRAVFARTR